MIRLPDLELWLTHYLRDTLDYPDLQIDIRKPEDYSGKYPLLTIRDDGGLQDEFTRFTHDIAINVYAGNKSNPQMCKRIANEAYARLTDFNALYTYPQSPILTVNKEDCTTPHAITSTPNIAHYYFVVALATVCVAD